MTEINTKMQTFESLLAELDTTLKKYNPGAYQNLLPPLSNKEIDKNLADIKIHDNNVKALFQWKGGAVDEYGDRMIEEGSLLTFDTIKASIEANSFFDPALIHIISNFEIGLLFNTNPGKHYGKIYYTSTPELFISKPISIYDSLSCLVKTVIVAYQQGIYYLEDGQLQRDWEGFPELARKYNPDSMYWIDNDPLAWDEKYEI